MEELKSLVIKTLINNKDEIVNRINEIADYMDLKENDTDLTDYDIQVINSYRKQIKNTYELIDFIENMEEWKRD